MARVALKFGYSPENFHGYARQPSLRTVEETLIDALIGCGIIEGIEENFFRSGSRTDRGVWAGGNVCAFDTAFPVEGICGALNCQLSDIWVMAATKVDDDFNPRFALKRTYLYFMPDAECVLDIDAMRIAGEEFSGSHDFTNFARVEVDRTPIRCIDSISISRTSSNAVMDAPGPFVVFEISAPNFLWNQVRRMVGALGLCGEKILSRDDIRVALEDPKIPVDYGLAPPAGLVLQDVAYKGVEFVRKPSSVKRLKERLLKDLVSRQISTAAMDSIIKLL